MNTVISRTDSFETWRKGTNKISASIGDGSKIGSNFVRRKIVLKTGVLNFEVGDTIEGTIPKFNGNLTTAKVIEAIPDENTLIVDNLQNGEFVDINQNKILIILKEGTVSQDFVAGETVTGLTSGATGKVFSYQNTDFSRLVLYDVEGIFLDNETLSNDPDSAGVGDTYGDIFSVTNTFIEKGETIKRITGGVEQPNVDEVVFAGKDVVTALNEVQSVTNQFEDLVFTNDDNGNKIIFGTAFLFLKLDGNASGTISTSDIVKQYVVEESGISYSVSGEVVSVSTDTVKLKSVIEYSGNTFKLTDTTGIPSSLLDNDFVDTGFDIIEVYYGSDDPYLEWNNSSETLFVYSDNSGAAKLNVDSVYANNYYGIDTTQYFVSPSTLTDVDTTTDDLSVYVKGDIATDGNKIILNFDGTRGQIEWNGSDFSFDGSTLSELISVSSGVSSLLALSDVDEDSTGELLNDDILIYNSSLELWQASQLSISQLSDVSTSGVSDGQVLKWSVANSRWQPASDLTSSGTGISLTDLSVTDNNSPTLLSYDNSTGVFTLAAIDLNDLNDVNAGSPSDGQVLSWDNGTSKWIASSVSGTGTVIPSSGSGNDGYIPRFLTSDGTSIGTSEIYQNGSSNIGIGLTNPSSKLQVNGEIRASSFANSTGAYYLKPSDTGTSLKIAGTLNLFSSTEQFEISRADIADDYLSISETDTIQIKKSGIGGKGFQFNANLGDFYIDNVYYSGNTSSGWWGFSIDSTTTNRAGIFKDGYEGNSTYFYDTGDLVVQGAVYAELGFVNTSDKNLKDNILTLEDSLVKVKQLRGVSFKWKSDKHEKSQIGLIAQEVQEVIPEVVEQGRDGTLGVNYSALIAHLIEAIKTQDKRIEELERKLDLYK